MTGRFAVGTTVIVGALLWSATCSASGGKIADSGNLTLNEGDTQAVQVSLDAPIICPGGVNPCNLAVNYVASDPSRISISPSSITWDSTQWSQIRTINVTALNSGTYNNGKMVTITGTAVSSAVYYSGYQDIFTATINSVAPPPAPNITNIATSVANNSSVSVNVLSGVGNNPDSSTLLITSGPSHGTAVDPPGVITYTPDKGYVGSDSLTYQVCSSLDSASCASAVLSFDVTANSPDTGYGSPWVNKSLIIATSLSCISIFLGLCLFNRQGKSSL